MSSVQPSIQSRLKASPPSAVTASLNVATPVLIDNVASYPTPEGLLLKLMPAGLMPRLSAWLIDLLIKLVIFMLFGIAGIFFGEAGMGFIAIGYFLLNWLYPVYFEVYHNGMTPGKKRNGIYVCHDDGTPITLQASLIRNLLRVADFLPFMFTSAALTMLFSKKSQRIGDIVAGTIVVYRKDDDIATLFSKVYGKFSKLAVHSGIDIQSNTNTDTTTNTGSNATNNLSSNVLNNVTSNTVHNDSSHNASNSSLNASHPSSSLTNAPIFYFPLTSTEQQALLAFTERAPYLSAPRQLEIAKNLLPLIDMNLVDHKTDVAGTTSVTDTSLLTAINVRSNGIRGFNPDATTDKKIAS